MGRSKITTRGEDVPKPVLSFKQMNKLYTMPNYMMQAIEKSGFEEPTNVQAQVIPLMMDRREIVCSAPTGSGKTLAFMIPILLQLKDPMRCGSFRAVILAPTRELAKQIHRESLWLSHGSQLRIHLIKDIKEAAKKFNPESMYKYDILVTTPNRLAVLLQHDPPQISLDKLEWLIIDECDRLFELGFKDQLSTIYTHAMASGTCRRAMFSATFDQHLEKWAKQQMSDMVTVIIGGKNKTAPNVEQEIVEVGNENGKLHAMRNMIQSGVKVPVLIFVDTIDKAKRLFDEFQYDNINIDVMHSERDQADRDAIVTKFREGKIWFLICTELMSRGIDFKAVNLVINYDFPKTFVNYIHRIGRTGRGNREGKAVTFFANSDIKFLRPIVNVMRRSGCNISDSLIERTKKKPKKKGKDAESDQNSHSKSKRTNYKYGKFKKEGTTRGDRKFQRDKASNGDDKRFKKISSHRAKKTS